jgi:hypothetical protein
MLEAVLQGSERKAALAPYAQYQTRRPKPENTFGIEPVDIFDEPIGNPQHSAERLGRQVANVRYPGHV